MWTNGGDTSWLNGNNKGHNRIIYNMDTAVLPDSNTHEKNGAVHQNHQQKSIDKISIVN